MRLMAMVLPGVIETIWVMMLSATAYVEGWPPTPLEDYKPPYVPKRLRRQCFWNTPYFIRACKIARSTFTYAYNVISHLSAAVKHHFSAPSSNEPTRGRPRKRKRRHNHSYLLRLRNKGLRTPPRKHRSSRSEGASCHSATTQQEHRRLIVDSDSHPVLVDNGASYCMTNNINDFITYRKKKTKSTVRGIGRTQTEIEGTIPWSIEDDDGRTHTFLIDGCLLVPTLEMRVLSAQHWSQHLKAKGIYASTDTDADRLLMKWAGYTKHIPLDPGSNVGFTSSPSAFDKANKVLSALSAITVDDPYCYPVHIIPDDESADTQASEGAPDDETMASEGATSPNTSQLQQPSETDPTLPPEPLDFDIDDQHLIEPDEEGHEDSFEYDDPTVSLLQWHYRLGHVPFDKLKRMSQSGELPAHLQRCRTPKCAACLYGKAAKRPWRTKSPPNRRTPPVINGPGDCVSVDQLESSTPGLIAQLRGFITKERYRHATVFVDHYSRLSFVYCQRTSKGDETLEAKRAFEAFAKSHGVTIKHYHADNGRFAEAAFMNHCKENRQTISFCGVNAHWQNGIAEKRIRDLQDQARTMLVHAQHRWRPAINAHLWPYAVRMANDVHMNTPLKSGQTPIDLFSQVAKPSRLRHFHPFGCPVYVLDARMQENNKGPKWRERARLGIYLGNSPLHSRSVALVLNIETGLCSPQFHVSFDDFSETVKDSSQPILWPEKCYFAEAKHDTQEPTSPPTPDTIVLPPAIAAPQSQSSETTMDAITAPEGANTDETTTAPTSPTNDTPPTTPAQSNDSGTDPQAPAPDAAPGTSSEQPLRRSLRSIKAPERLIAQTAFIAQPWDDVWQIDDYEIQESLSDPIAFAATSNPDVMYLHEALRAPDRKQFIAAMQKEVSDHEKNGHWEVVPREDVPEGTKVLPAVWSMKRKRRIATNEIYKWKARLNVGGHKQEKGVHYDETYSPVVAWFAIRFFLTLAIINGWHSRQLDFVLAYPQADIEKVLYMDIPQGFHHHHSRKSHVLRLKKNLYGQKQAGRVWNQHLHKGLTQLGFVQSKIDECVYYRDKVIFLCYVDDSLIFSPNAKDIDQVIKELEELNYDVSDEGDIDDYLGVKVQRLTDGSIKLSQPHLIDQILKDLGLHNSDSSDRSPTKTAPTPALSTVTLNRDKDGEPHDAPWNYRSVIGKLNFLEKSTRPELAYSVHQAARFSSDPKKSHSQAVKRIGRFLLASREDGIILRPDPSRSVDCYTDADFCGLWDPKLALYDPTTAKSRTGYLIMYAGCPILWASKLQTDTALSTTEAEYSAASEALRNVLPLMELIQEAHDQGIDVPAPQAKMHCRLFIDNSGAVELIRLPKMRPRTKHINTRMHHFREHLLYKQGKITPHLIKTDEQLIDIATKPLAVSLFNRFWRVISGIAPKP